MQTLAALEQWLAAIHVARAQRQRLSAAIADQFASGCAAHALDALVVTSLPNILYLTNFTGSSAIAVVTADRCYSSPTSGTSTTIAAMRGTPSECPSLELVTVDGSYDATLAALLAALSSRASRRASASKRRI